MRKARSTSTKRSSPRSSKGLTAVSPGLSRAELYAMGKALRDKCPRASHAKWVAHRNRPDPLELILVANKGRLPELVPIRHGRMLRSPFTLYRGAALNMAADLAGTPVSGLRVQACGDAHLCNFGAFATPERRLIFDINDLDETLPAPWEWDVKRLAASIVVASRSNGFSSGNARDAVLASVRSYREHMAELSQMRVLDVWYASLELESLVALFRDKSVRQRQQKRMAKARERSVAEHDFPKLAALQGKEPRIKDNPPLIYHLQQEGETDMMARTRASFAEYRATMQADRRVLLDRFELKDMAMKVVGVGSVGTYCAVLLLMASESDPLFLQVKEARKSVLEPYAGPSVLRQPRRAGRQRDPAHAVGQRHLSRVGQGTISAAISTCVSSAT